MLFHGQVQADLVSEVQESLHRLQRRQQLKQRLKAAMEHGLKSVEVYVKGPGSGREANNQSIADSWS